MDAVSDAAFETVVIKSSAQVGKTELLLNIIGFHMHHFPSPILAVLPTIEMSLTFSKDRLAPMCRDTPALRDKIMAPRSRVSTNTLLHKGIVGGGHITLAGANSPASLASRPVRLLLCDEIDRWPHSAGTEGCPLALAKRRTATFWDRRIVLVSTPTVKGLSKIEHEFNQSDQRYYHVPCPFCGKKQTLIWENLIWEKDSTGAHLPETAKYRCDGCSKLIDESYKMSMLKDGEWVPSKPTKRTAGFAISALSSPWERWPAIVEHFLSAKDNPLLMQVFTNTILGLTYEQSGEVPDWRILYQRRENYPISVVPRRAVMLTAGVDVQADRLEIVLVGWNRKEAFVVDHIVLPGSTSEVAVWRELTEILNRDWPHESGDTVPLSMMMVDSGFQSLQVYRWVRGSGRRARAIKGRDSIQTALGSPSKSDVNAVGKKIRGGVQVWPVGVSIIKADLYGRLKLQTPTESELAASGYPTGYIHFPMLGESFFKQLTAESLVMTTMKTGRTKSEWIKHYPNNEVLDCLVYNVAAFHALGANRWTETRWQQLEKHFS